MSTINPYLNYEGKAEEAFRFYQSILGGDLTIMRMSDAPGTEGLPENEKNYVMHASLPVGSNVLMASDCLESAGHKLKPGNYSYISLSPDSREEADRIFNGLSAGGEVEMPMADMFWGDYFGSFKDQFGIPWMINFNGNTTAKD